MNRYKVFLEDIMLLIKKDYKLEIDHVIQTDLTGLILIISFKINEHTFALKAIPNFDMPINKIVERMENEIDNLILKVYKR